MRKSWIYLGEAENKFVSLLLFYGEGETAGNLSVGR
jgi:hypothetical protein